MDVIQPHSATQYGALLHVYIYRQLKLEVSSRWDYNLLWTTQTAFTYFVSD